MAEEADRSKHLEQVERYNARSWTDLRDRHRLLILLAGRVTLQRTHTHRHIWEQYVMDAGLSLSSPKTNPAVLQYHPARAPTAVAGDALTGPYVRND